jgi:mannose/fructose/N-acetylgalactosamine-specific phosphotransferase system component IIC
MEVSTGQALLIALYAGIAALTELPIMALPLTFAMPMLVGPVVGLILGDMATGLVVGISLELVWLGLTSIGGTVPPDKVVGTTLATVLVIVGELDYEAALAVVLPAALIGQAFGILVQTINSFTAHWADRFAQQANTGGISLVLWLGNALHFLVRFVPVLIALTLGVEATQSLVAAVPEWLTNDIGVGGALLPAVGFSLLMVMILKRELWPWFLIGFILAAALSLNTITIGILAVAAAILIGVNRLQAQRASAG